MPKSKSSKTSSNYSDSLESAVLDDKETDTGAEDVLGDSSASGSSADSSASAADKGDEKPGVVVGVFFPPTSDPGMSSLQHLNISIDIINPGQSIAADAAIASENKLREAVASEDTNSAGQLLDTTARTDPQAEAAKEADAAPAPEAAGSGSASSAASTDSSSADSSISSAITPATTSDASSASDSSASSAPLA